MNVTIYRKVFNERNAINQPIFPKQRRARSGDIIQKLMVVQLVKIPHLLWNTKIIAMFTKARNLTLSFSVKFISAHFSTSKYRSSN
jgi:hypothetical protein